jgi:hypothetical protein
MAGCLSEIALPVIRSGDVCKAEQIAGFFSSYICVTGIRKDKWVFGVKEEEIVLMKKNENQFCV